MILFKTKQDLQNKIPKIIGLAILIMAISAGFSYGLVYTKLIINDNASLTMNNIINSIYLFRWGIFGWLITILCDIIASWGLYVYFKEINKNLALLGCLFRLFYTVILTIAVSNLISILVLLNNNTEIIPFNNEQLQNQLLMLIGSFNTIWSFGLIFFGLHLLIVSCLMLRSKFIPKTLVILLFIASFSYIAIHFSHIFIPKYENTTIFIEKILSIPMAIGELSLGVWLFIKGGKHSKLVK